MSRCWPHLLSLNVNGIGFSNAVITRARKLSKLNKLYIGSEEGYEPTGASQNFTDDLFPRIREGQDWPWRELTQLSLTGKNFTDRVFEQLRQANSPKEIWPLLTSLSLDSPQFSEAVIDRLPQGIWPELNSLSINMNTEPDPPNFLQRLLRWLRNSPNFFGRIKARWSPNEFKLSINQRPKYPYW